MSDSVDKLAKKIWNFMLMRQPLEKADAIIVFGSYNPIVANRAAELYLQGLAPVIVFSGNRSDSTLSWPKTEAETMADIARGFGVPPQSILTETRATNSGENILFSRELLRSRDIHTNKIIVIQKPYGELRAYATVRKRWPEVEVMVTSPDISYEEYMATTPKGKQGSIETMVGDLQRLDVYAKKGFQIPQEIPSDVQVAYDKLVELGYGKWLVKE